MGRDPIDKLEILKVSHVEELLSGVVDDVLNKHPTLFQNELGKLTGVQVEVYVEEGSTPIFFKPRSLPYAMRGKVEEELKRLEQEKVIEPVKYSEWAAPIVPVLKTNGQVRICGDYKVTVNKFSKM